MPSFPPAFIASLGSLLGSSDAARTVQALSGESSVSVRLNPFKRPEGGEPTVLAGSAPVPWSPYGRILAERPVFTLHPLFHALFLRISKLIPYVALGCHVVFVFDLFLRRKK